MSIVTVPVRRVEGRVLDDPFAVYRTVMSGNIVILKGVVSSDECRRARNTVFTWGQNTPATLEHPLKVRRSVHMASYLPPKSKSRYIFHSYEFYFGDLNSESELSREVRPVFARLQQIYRELTSDSHELAPGADGCALLPQCIQYPQGGGFFQEHVHDFAPQQIGLILAASEIGVDYQVGAVRFRSHAQEDWTNTEGHHHIGDVCLFRYDMPHDVTPVDSNLPLDWSKNSGRWSFVLPIKQLPEA
jgi:hypothetical protein